MAIPLIAKNDGVAKEEGATSAQVSAQRAGANLGHRAIPLNRRNPTHRTERDEWGTRHHYVPLQGIESADAQA